jgi:hypothetical protein
MPILQNLRVASPCTADWELMTGDDKSRFCKACEKQVYNLPLLDAAELVDLIERTEGKFCGRLYQRTDGTVLTADCPIGLSVKLAKARRGRRVAAAAVLTSLVVAAGAFVLGVSYGGAGIEPLPPLVAGGITAPPEPLMGDIAVPEEIDPETPQDPEVKEEPSPEQPPIRMGLIRPADDDR